MGFPKALLPYRGTTFLEYLANLLDSFALRPLVVVLGHEPDRIQAAVKLPSAARVVINADYPLGQLSSLQAAIRAVQPENPPRLLVTPVDHPCISREVVQALLDADGPVVIPTYGGRRGHPVILSAALFPELLDAPLDQGARAVVRRYQAVEVPVGDPGVLANIDDRDAYARFILECGGLPPL